MRIYALDATPVLHRPTGIGRYVRELVGAMAPRLEPDERVRLYAGTARLNPAFGVSHDRLIEAAGHEKVDFRRQWFPLSSAHAWWNRFPFPPVQWVTGPISLFHGTNFLLPPTGRSAGVVTVHDLSPLSVPDAVPPRVAHRFRRAVGKAVERAQVVITDSQFVAGEVRERLGVPADRVSVIPLGVSQDFAAPGEPAADREHLAKRLGIEPPFVLFVGTTNPRKNLHRLLGAFAEARRAGRFPHRLVLAGDPGFAHPDVRARIEELHLLPVTRSTGYVGEADLATLYRTADLLAFPSLHEGFGLPVLEAMAAGCPVLTSDTTALAEVAGDAAVRVNPTSQDAIAGALARLLGDPAQRSQLAAAGRARAARFTWVACAARHLEVYRRVSG